MKLDEVGARLRAAAERVDTLLGGNGGGEGERLSSWRDVAMACEDAARAAWWEAARWEDEVLDLACERVGGERVRGVS